MPNCVACNKPLQAIGKKRKNGKYYFSNKGNDWKGRQFHKKCFPKSMRLIKNIINDSKLSSENKKMKILEIFPKYVFNSNLKL